MAGSGAIMVMDETTDIPMAALTLCSLLRPRVLRQVRALPGRRHVVVAHPRARRATATARWTTSTSCSPSARRSAPALPARVEREARPRGGAVPVQDDHDLLRRPVGVHAGALGASRCSARSSRPRRAQPQAHPRPRSGSRLMTTTEPAPEGARSTRTRCRSRSTVVGDRAEGRAHHRRGRAGRRCTSRASATTTG